MTAPAERSGPSDPVDAEIDRLLESHPPRLQPIARAVLASLREALPGAVVQVDRPDRVLAVGTGTRMRDILFAIVVHGGHVNLQLADGATLPDPAGIVEGTGKRIRHVRLRSMDDVDRAAVGQLIRAQVDART